MTREQPGPQEQDPDETLRLRLPGPAEERSGQGPPEAPSTQHLPYTPDMLPDVPVYEAEPPRSAWRWVVVVGGLVLLVAVVAVAVILWLAASSP
ncbi:hypothetical protein [Nonomuraea candida]|uniref:hypothetical protein n=1 Tax=Nonomuraea candida TaxID=359159 RepID=UPI000AE14725|nr:hypothetical protein [Nonomuraea candida]